MKLWAALTIVLVLSPLAEARKNDGVRAQLGVGKTVLSIANPDSTKAHYDGLSAQAKGYIPVFATETFRTDFTGSVRYLDFENSGNTPSQSEYAQYIGPGAGVEISFYGIFVGADYFLLKGRHVTVGNFSKKIEFNITGANIYYGLRYRLGLGSIGVSSGSMTSSIAKKDSGLASDSAWKTTDIYVEFTYNFEMGTFDFIKSLFKN